MKSAMKLIIVALIFAALLAIPSAVSARQYNVTDIQAGDVAFIYETGLNVTNLDTDAVHAVKANGIPWAPPKSFRKFANDQPDPTVAGGGSMLAEIPLNPVCPSSATSFAPPGAMCLDINSVPAYTGIWFPYNASAPGYHVNANNSIQIQHADVTLDAVLNQSHTDSIATKSVTRDNLISFKLISTYAGNYYKNTPTTATGTYYDAMINIVLTTPGGGQVQVFGTGDANQGSLPVDLRNLVLNGSVEYTDSLPQGSDISGGVGTGISLAGVEAGTYTAVAKWVTSMPWYNLEANSNAITFTVLSKPITITTNKETVVRGNSFVVTITGESKTTYWVYLKDAGISSTNSYPQIAPGQSFVNSTIDGSGYGGRGAGGNHGGTASDNLLEINATLTDVNPASTGTSPQFCSACAFGAPSGAFNQTMANVSTAADGTRTIQFNTVSSTDDKKYTVKVVDPTDTSKYDQVDVSVEKGAVTISYSGTGTYYLGETVELTGTNTDNTSVWLAVKGPNLNDGGVSLADIACNTDGSTAACGARDTVRFKRVDVNTDNTWSYKWDTSKLSTVNANMGLDAGTYTIYAVASPVASLASTNLANQIYETAAVVLKKPFVTAATSANTIAKGDILYITGTAEGKPNNVYIWLFGTNYRSLSNAASVQSDASFSYKLDRGDTTDLYAGQYFAVVQHPMMNGKQDIVADATGLAGTKAEVSTTGTWTVGAGGSATIVNLVGLQASDAATALVDLLNSPNVDDTYTKLSFMVEEPWIRIDTIGDHYVGDTFSITGTTNLAEGDTILMTVTSTAFQPTEKTQAGEFSGTSGSVSVQKGDTYNTFSFSVDASTFKPDEYLVKAESVEPSQSTTATFNILEGPATTATTVAPTAAATTAAVTTAPPTVAATTAAPVTTAKPQPGFGAAIALVGLGAVALLVLRRR